MADFATSEMAYVEFAKYKKESKALPKGVALDTNGQPTTAPHKAEPKGIVNPLAIGGGYKGFSIVLLMEILTSSLVRGLLSTEQDKKQFYPIYELGAFVIAIDISTFNDVDKFKDSVTAMCDELRKQPLAKGSTHIYMPGDQSYARLNKAIQCDELEIDNGSYNFLK